MSGIGLAGVMMVVGQMLVGIISGSASLWVQRRFFLFEEEDQSFSVPSVVAVFTSFAYFWTAVSGGL